MTMWKQTEGGILVAEQWWKTDPRRISIATLRKYFKDQGVENKYLLAKPRRDTIPGGEREPEGLESWQPLDPEKLKDHVLGRAEESLKVLVGAAVLRSLGWLERDPEVGYRGAQFQRGEGSGPYQAAHRFPCDPTINRWSIPHYSRSRALAAELEEPLRKTDYLPRFVNSADSRFERNGGKQAVVEPIRFVLHEQKTGQPPNPVMVRHALLNMMLPAYKLAYCAALQLPESDEADAEMIRPEAREEIRRASLVRLDQVDLSRPSSCPPIVRFALWYGAHLVASAGEPVGASQFAIARYARILETKSKLN